jgi:hypothetical protein
MTLAHVSEDLVGCGVIIPLQHGCQDGMALDGAGDALLLTQSFELVEPQLFGVLIHAG